jgi:hypothetical protein
MNWPESYKLIGDSLIADISLPGEASGLVSIERDPRKKKKLPDCYEGVVKEVGAQCKLASPGDKIVFARWIYSQSNVDDALICLREVDLVVVNNECVNGFVAVKVFNPFKRVTELTLVDKGYEVPKNFYGQIVSIDQSNNKNVETQHLKENDIICFQRMEEYQYQIGQHTMVFKNIRDSILFQLEEAEVLVNA